VTLQDQDERRIVLEADSAQYLQELLGQTNRGPQKIRAKAAWELGGRVHCVHDSSPWTKFSREAMSERGRVEAEVRDHLIENSLPISKVFLVAFSNIIFREREAYRKFARMLFIQLRSRVCRHVDAECRKMHPDGKLHMPWCPIPGMLAQAKRLGLEFDEVLI
jgi:hypothetical protein